VREGGRGSGRGRGREGLGGRERERARERERERVILTSRKAVSSAHMVFYTRACGFSHEHTHTDKHKNRSAYHAVYAHAHTHLMYLLYNDIRHSLRLHHRPLPLLRLIFLPTNTLHLERVWTLFVIYIYIYIYPLSHFLFHSLPLTPKMPPSLCKYKSASMYVVYLHYNKAYSIQSIKSFLIFGLVCLITKKNVLLRR
jgi:hypothetical protein